jgi:hypothetical protein
MTTVTHCFIVHNSCVDTHAIQVGFLTMQAMVLFIFFRVFRVFRGQILLVD